MRSIEHARTKGREARQQLGGARDDLLARVQAHLQTDHQVNLVRMPGELLHGGRAELDGETRTLQYDQSIDGEDLLAICAHELGHLVLHNRLGDSKARPDPLFASVYGTTGPAALARYNPRTHEESQATAFALEFLAPSDEVWEKWCDTAEANSATLAAEFGCRAEVIHTQLAHALHAIALGGTEQSASRKAVEGTAAQLAAARFTGAPAIVDAGPGTGKTATVLRRIRFLIEERKASPRNILALTFSNEAAQELSERIAIAFSAETADAINVRTFHGFGMEFLHSHGHLLGLSERLELLDDERQVELVNVLLGMVPCEQLINLRAPRETATRVVEQINFCKQRLIGADALEEGSQLAGVWRAYEARNRSAGRIDFADLIALPISVLEQHVHVRRAYATRFPWVIVDEFQDVTRATSRLLRALCGPSNPPWVVGDARQSIYQFLGAAPENVTAFTRDFKNARAFELDVNYRSSEAIVTAANQLAALLENADGAADGGRVRWTAGAAMPGMPRAAVTIAEAATDAAEVEGVARRVSDWIACDGVSPGDIAVLCRRHVDVRKIILELGGRGIKAQASGMLTAEGAAGDLAAMVTLADAPAASGARAVFALGRGRQSTDELNGIVGDWLAALRAGRRPDVAEPGDDDVTGEIAHLYEMLMGQRDRADGFTTVATILFDGGYLRRTLALADQAERQMALVEIVSVLSLATAYRVTHLETDAGAARLGFAERLRVRLTRTLPVPLTPRPRSDAVHVMTCHASKGLEFPCVAVVGQTLPAIASGFDWLPPAMRPETAREEAQANALLFVGVTRAQRSVLVSFPRRAGAGTRGKGKAVVPLLERWRAAFNIPTEEWSVETGPESGLRVGNIWGVPAPTEVRAQAIDESVCSLLTYLEGYVGARFPEAEPELYPAFFGSVRGALRRVAASGVETGSPVSEEEARGMLAVGWRADQVAGHPHEKLYRNAAERMVAGFARAFRPMVVGGMTRLDAELVLPSMDGLDVRLDLIAHYGRPDGGVAAIAFRPESLRAESSGAESSGLEPTASDEYSLKWSELSESKRSSLALLESVRPGTTAYVYSGADERIYAYKWSRNKKSLPTLAAGLEARRAAMARGEFGGEVGRYQCDRCRGRVMCPRWVGAVEG